MAEFKIITPTNAELDLNDNPYFYLVEISNQTFFDSSTYTFTNSSTDGSTVNYMSVNPRQLTFTVVVKPQVDVEEAKRYIFRNLKPKQNHKIIWERNNRTLTINGKFESASFPRWSKQVKGQLSFYCESPFWESDENIIQIISDTISTHYFTDQPDDMLYFYEEGIVMGEYDAARVGVYENDGDVETPLSLEIHAVNTVTNPVISLNETDNYIGIDDTLQAGDIVTITTSNGNKDVRKNGVSVLNKIKQGSSFLKLALGTNTFTLSCDDEETDNVYLVVSYKNQYV